MRLYPPVEGWRRLAPYLIVLALLGGFTFLIRQQRGPDILARYYSLDNLQLVTTHAMIVATVAIGMTLLMISGGIDLSVGYVVSLVTVTTVLASRPPVA